VRDYCLGARLTHIKKRFCTLPDKLRQGMHIKEEVREECMHSQPAVAYYSVAGVQHEAVDM